MAKKKKKERGQKAAPQASDPKCAVISFRARISLVSRIDAHAQRLRDEQPGSSWSRSSAALNLCMRALDQIEGAR